MSRRDPSSENLEQPTKDDEDSPCIGEDQTGEVKAVFHTDRYKGPESEEVYGRRWE